MSRSIFAPALLALAALLSPHARASNTDPGGHTEETPPGPAVPLALPKNTIGPSAPVGYLGGGGGVTPAGSYAWELGFWVPPGLLVPDVRISHSSRGGNDLLGVNFSLGGDLAEIHRCGQTIAVDGQVTGADFSSGDRFCLSGQRLVLIKGKYGESGSEYRAERDGFDKIIFHEGNPFVPSYFDVWTKDGRILTYEGLKAPRAKPSPSPPYSLEPAGVVDAFWVLTEQKDRAGNRVRYGWKTLSFPELPDEHSVEYFPERIDYTLRPGDIAGPREVRFVYEDRPDPSFTFLSGVRIRTTKRLKAVELHAPNPIEKGLVGRYELSYLASATTGRSLLQTIKRCDAQNVCLWGKRFAWENSARPDFTEIDLGLEPFPSGFFEFQKDTGFLVFDADGDGKDELLYRVGPDYFVRRMSADGTPLGEQVLIDPIASGPPGVPGFENILLSQTRVVDMDGDGALELWAMQTIPFFSYHLFNYDSASGSPKSMGLFFEADALSAGQDIFLEAIHFGDFDGDGRSDMLHQDYIAEALPFWNIYKNVGGMFDTANAILTPVPAHCGRASRLLDGDGDGRAEVWSASEHGCGKSTTMGLASSGDEAEAFEQHGLGYEAKRAVWADLNGDGLRDIVRPASPEGWVRFSTGVGYGPKETLTNGPYPDPNADDGMDQGTHVADINDDGREDILAFRFSPSPKIIAYLSRGDGSFNTVDLSTWPGRFHALEGFSTTKPGDFNGDGLLDVVLIGDDNHLRVLEQKPGQVDVVREVWDDLVAEHPREVIHYSNQWSDSPEPATCVFPQRCIRHGLPVVREHWTWQGEDVGAYHKARYSYEDPRVDLQGRGFLGFSKVRVWDADRLTETTTTFDHETRFGNIYPYAGLPMTVTHVAPIFEEAPASFPAVTQARVTRIENTYALNLLNQWKTHVVHPSTWSLSEWEQDVVIRPDRIELPASPRPEILRRRSGSYEHDTYGNLTKAEEQTEGGVYRKVERTYDIRPDDWLISLPENVSFTSTTTGLSQFTAPRVTRFEHNTKGFIRSIKVEPTSSDPHQQLTTTFERNANGQVHTITWEAAGEAPRRLYISYQGQEGIFPEHVWNDLGFYQSFVHHPAYGVLAVSSDIDGVKTWRQYDGFARPVRVETDGASGSETWITPRVEGGFVRGLVEHTKSDTGEEGYVVYDEVGRPVEEASRAFDGQWSRVAATYDLLGRLIAVTRPAFGVLSTNKTKNRYDSLDRLLETLLPDGAKTKHRHAFFEHRSWDANQNESYLAYDLDGRIERSVDIKEGKEIPTTYAYGDFDQIERITDAQNNVTSIAYDQRGRRTLLIDPDRGPTSFQWNGFGELLWEENALGAITYKRDILGRVYQREFADEITSFVYDQGPNARGKLSEATSPDGTKIELRYDFLGRQETSTWTVDGGVYAFRTHYDEHGRIKGIDYPEVPGRARFGVELTYNAFGYREQVRDTDTKSPFWTVKSRNADGALTEAWSGTGIQHLRSYYPLTGRLDVLQTVGNGSLDAIKHIYHPNGSLNKRQDSVKGRNETFWYDELDRLKMWQLITASGVRLTSYEHDDIGNLTKVSAVNFGEEQNIYGENGRPHAVTTSPTGSHVYDEAGRLIQGGGRNIHYTSFDLPRLILQGGVSTQFAYDAFQQRVHKTNGADATISLADLYERRVRNGIVEHVFFVHGDFGPAAEVHFIEDATTPIEKTRYLHGDALGSVRVVTDADGVEVERAYFEPFGRRTKYDGSPIAPGAKPEVELGFTGHPHDDDLGLINMGGRIFDPGLRRFLTPDPVVSMPLFGQSYNRYAYAFGNPLRYIDPTGFENKDPKNCNGCIERGQWTLRGTFNLGPTGASTINKNATPTAKGTGQAKNTTTAPAKPSNDASGSSPPTGPTAAPAPPPSSTPEPEAEVVTELEAESWKDSTPVQGIGGFVGGVLLGVVPGAGMGERVLSAGGVLAPGTRAANIGKAFGEMVGGAALMFFGAGGTAAGVGVSATGIGAAVGVPAVAVSAGLVTAGAANAAAGFQGLLVALTTGGGSGGGPPVHHIATNKNDLSTDRGGPWSPRFRKIFDKAGMSLDDAANKVSVPGHRGPHPEAYHQEVYDRLTKATEGLSGNAYNQALRAELDAIRKEAVTPGSNLNKLLTEP